MTAALVVGFIVVLATLTGSLVLAWAVYKVVDFLQGLR